MHFRRFAAFLLGAWLAGCLFMDMVATQNFRSVDRLLAAPSPQLAERVQAMGGHDAARMLLRHQVAEQNRWYFETWEQAQIVLGVALFLVLLFGAVADRWMLFFTLLMLSLVLIAHFALTPEITRLGRAFDFVPPGASSPDRARFWLLHGSYSAIELIKLGAGIVLAVLLVRRRRSPKAVAVSEPMVASHLTKGN
jgi:cell division protein FtsW (lipid II flippase)